jgi:hypothetical protein
LSDLSNTDIKLTHKLDLVVRVNELSDDTKRPTNDVITYDIANTKINLPDGGNANFDTLRIDEKSSEKLKETGHM